MANSNPPPRDLAGAFVAPIEDLLAAAAERVVARQGVVDAEKVDQAQATIGGGDEVREALQRLGLEPTTARLRGGEVKIATELSATASTEQAGGNRIEMCATVGDTASRRRYSFDLRAASQIRARLLPT